MQFTYKYSSCTLEYIPNDVSIKLISYLIDSNGQLYIDPNTLAIDTFTVQLYKSSLPVTSVANYISIMAGNAISTKYNQTIGGYCVSGSNVVTQITGTSNTANINQPTSVLIPGLYVNGTNIPVDTTLLNIRDAKSIELSKPLTVTENATLTLTTNGWSIDYSAIDELVTIIDFSNI